MSNIDTKPYGAQNPQRFQIGSPNPIQHCSPWSIAGISWVFICLVGRSPWLVLWVCQQNGTWHCLALDHPFANPSPRGIRGVSRPTTGSPNRRNMAEVRIGISRRPCPPWGEHNSFLCVETYKKSLGSWGEERARGRPPCGGGTPCSCGERSRAVRNTILYVRQGGTEITLPG